ncbi:MAG: diaminopimelate epimerase [Lachnospiraceae bacterium]|nr:diaminopimelate epimerase [Lachnospiraceae bacterium]
MKFTKMHGCGNDYVYVNLLTEKVDDYEKAAIKVSDRHFGIGSDGLIMIDKSDVADFRMIMYNADGSRGKMCGNGIRCVAKFVYDHGMTDKTTLNIETDAGIKILELNVLNGKVQTVRVNMGEPELVPANVPVIFEGDRMINEEIIVNGEPVKITAVSMGNPHAVTFVPEVDNLDLEKIGPYYEKHELFPERINTEFIKVISENELSMRVWERGSGETFACGTGACASAVAAYLNGLTGREVLIHLRGGDLNILYNEDDNCVYMTGPATTVFEGEIELD